MSYIDRIRAASTRHEAADLVLANATHSAAGLRSCYSAAERTAIIDKAADLAATLTRDYSLDGDSPCPEPQHPWRQWLAEAGY